MQSPEMESLSDPPVTTVDDEKRKNWFNAATKIDTQEWDDVFLTDDSEWLW